MQIHGRKCKIHLDPAIAAAGESPAVMQVIFKVLKLHFMTSINQSTDPTMNGIVILSIFRMPWQGQIDNMIDRFDGRAYLDIDRIPVVPKVKEIEEISTDERHCNYERYRILAQNDFLGRTAVVLSFLSLDLINLSNSNQRRKVSAPVVLGGTVRFQRTIRTRKTEKENRCRCRNSIYIRG